jgi:hypothetical protein
MVSCSLAETWCQIGKEIVGAPCAPSGEEVADVEAAEERRVQVAAAVAAEERHEMAAAPGLLRSFHLRRRLVLPRL